MGWKWWWIGGGSAAVVLAVVGVVIWLVVTTAVLDRRVPAEAAAMASQGQIDLTAAAAAMHAASSPGSSFAPGTVRRSGGRPQVTQTEYGYIVDFGHGSPVQTPAVHEGRVFAAGGFFNVTAYCLEAASGKLVWAMDLSDNGPSMPVVDASSGVAAFNTESCTLFALDADSGRARWSAWMGDPMCSAPSAADGLVFASYPARSGVVVTSRIEDQGVDDGPLAGVVHPAAEAGETYELRGTHVLGALDSRSGEVRWQVWLDGDVISAPVIADGDVWAATFSGSLYRIAAATGELKRVTACRVTSAPVVQDGKVIYTARVERRGEAAREAVVLADIETGKPVQRLVEQAAPYLDADVQRGAAYASEAMQWDAASGADETVWMANPEPASQLIGQSSVMSLQAYQGSRVVMDGRRLFVTMGDRVLCVYPSMGQPHWVHALEGDLHREGGSLGAPPVVAGEMVVIATLKGEILCLRADTGEVVQRYETGHAMRSQPAVSDGRIFAPTVDGRLVCVDTGDASVTGWPGFGGSSTRNAVR